MGCETCDQGELQRLEVTQPEVLAMMMFTAVALGEQGVLSSAGDGTPGQGAEDRAAVRRGCPGCGEGISGRGGGFCPVCGNQVEAESGPLRGHGGVLVALTQTPVNPN